MHKATDQASLRKTTYKYINNLMIIALIILLVREVTLSQHFFSVFLFAVGLLAVIMFNFLAQKTKNITTLSVIHISSFFVLLTIGAIDWGGLGTGNVLMYSVLFALMMTTVPFRYIWIPSIIGWGGMILTALAEIRNPEIRLVYDTSHSILYNDIQSFITIGFLYFVLQLIIRFYLQERRLVKEKTFEIKAQHNKLKEIDEFKSTLFAGLSHDLKSPGKSLLGLMELLDNSLITPEEFKSFLPEVKQQIITSNSLISNLFDWSKRSLMNNDLRFEEVNLNQLVKDEIEKALLFYPDKKVGVINRIFGISSLHTDPTLLQAIVRNLLVNAIKFTESGKNVSIFHFIDEQSHIIQIQDEGIGISKQDLSRLFTPKVVSNPGTDGEIGTGLGLIICKDFINKLGGEIWVESEVGNGSTFSFSVPIQISN